MAEKKDLTFRTAKPKERAYPIFDDKVTFQPLAFADMPLMFQWFNKPHVQQFYSLRSWTIDEVRDKLAPYILGEKPVFGFIIYLNKSPIGYIQTYRISDYPWPEQNFSEDIIQSAAGVDLFVGEEHYLQQGLGVQIMQAFLNQYIWSRFHYCIVDPDIHNLSAIRCYEKLHFIPHRVINTSDALGRAVQLQLMILRI